MTRFKIGDVVWVDEGDSIGCYEFGGVVEEINEEGELGIRVESHPIYAGVPHGSLRFTDPQCADKDDSWRRYSR